MVRRNRHALLLGAVAGSWLVGWPAAAFAQRTERPRLHIDRADIRHLQRPERTHMRRSDADQTIADVRRMAQALRQMHRGHSVRPLRPQIARFQRGARQAGRGNPARRIDTPGRGPLGRGSFNQVRPHVGARMGVGRLGLAR